MSKALIAMSGGVDSSVSAKLMTDAGFECIGCMMKLYDNSDTDGDHHNGEGDDENGKDSRTCCSLDDSEDARSVAYKLGMQFYVFNFKEEFRTHVIDNFTACYLKGMTPNPCIECNRFLKFNKLLERAQILGCDYVVTGHYARIEERNGEMVLLKGLDESKDQSYVLYMLSQEQLKHIRFPLGSLSKSEVRRIAEENGFVNAHKKDSQDICFVPDGDYASVVRKYSEKCRDGLKDGSRDGSRDGARDGLRDVSSDGSSEVSGDVPGNFVTLNGKTLGKHKGIINYTVGQRKGLGISADRPLYVHHIDVERNEVVLSDNTDLFSNVVNVPELSLTTDRKLPDGLRCSAKIRYHHKEQPGTLKLTGAGCVFTFDEPQRAITPGQSLVLYDGDRVLGGGIIAASGTK
ncbi:MAG: tRNA 2-thiouridine(34) synthase MnmA [Lachnospiraceae bacterium]|nr:tRNA 2-thiouridine(34) synthase MnmA [Lachnospiraceae bacterium]